MNNAIAKFSGPKKEGFQKCPVQLKHFGLGNDSLKFQKQINSSVSNGFRATKICFIFSTKSILPVIHKNAVSFLEQSNIIYEYVWRLTDGMLFVLPKNCRTESTNMYSHHLHLAWKKKKRYLYKM